LIAGGVRLGPLTGAASVPIPWDDPLPVAAFVGEGAAMPIISGSLAGPTAEPKRIALAPALTRQLLEQPHVEAIFTAMLTRAAARALDAAMFSDTAGDAVRPTGLLAGVNALDAGASRSADLTTLVDAITAAGGDGDIPFVMSPGRALAMRVGSNGQAPVFGSVAVTDTRLMAIDTAACFSSIGEPQVEASRQTVLHFEDTVPAQIGASSSATFPGRSLYQTDCIALKMTPRVGWAIPPGIA
jgi:hypothetical protein